MKLRHGLSCAVAALALSGVGVSAAHASPATTKAVPLTPCRLLDTRDTGTYPANSSHTLQVTGRCGVPADATAVSATVTAIRPDRPGWAGVVPTGRAVAATNNTATVNYAKDEVRANSQFLSIGDGGKVDIYTLAQGDYVIDITAFFVPSTESSDGRFELHDPYRALDTRNAQRFEASETRTIDLGIPDDAGAAVINVAIVDPGRAGFVTAWATGNRPTTSIVNSHGPGGVRIANALVPVTAGQVKLFSSTATHIVVDVSGYVTGPNSPETSAGLFVPVVPRRLIDTRDNNAPIWANGGREFGSQRSAGAVALNNVVVNHTGAGWVSVRPAGQAPQRQPTSSLNTDRAGGAVANSSFTRLSTRGVVAHAFMSTHFVSDMTGYFVGAPLAADHPVPPNPPPPASRAVIISDSALAGVRWNNAWRALQGFPYDARLESCRRLVAPSCRGREHYAPKTAVDEIWALPQPAPSDVLVISVGYNDWHGRFATDFDAVIAAARGRGFRRIAWMNYRSDVSYKLPGPVDDAFSNYAQMNATLLTKKASGAFPDVEIWDFNRYTSSASWWFHSDGVHETTTGSLGAADWISRHLAHLDGRSCAKPYQPGWQIERPCPNPDPLPEQRSAVPDVTRLY